MKRTLLVDGYNVIFAIADLRRRMQKDSRPAREALTGLCHLFKSRRHDVGEIIIVFDGREREEALHEKATPTTTHIYTTADEEADRRIFQIIRTAEDPAALWVVSGDRAVYDRAHSWGAGVMTSLEFAKHVERKDPTAGAGGWANPAASGIEKKIHPNVAADITREYGEMLGVKEKKPPQS